MNTTARCALGAALAAHLACASEIPTELDPDSDVAGSGAKTSAGRGGSSSGSGGITSQPQGGAGKGNGGMAGAVSSAGKSGASASAGAAGQVGSGGSTNGGAPGAAGAGGSVAQAGQAGSPNQATCDDATAIDLMTQYSNVAVASNACLELTLTSAQIKKITMQPDSGTYPVPFTWSSCTSSGSGAFTANYANQAMTPVSSQCPIYVKLGGSGDMLHFQWWGD